MSAAAFDNTMLSILLNPNGRVPLARGTKTPIALAKERAESVVASLQKARRRIIIPAPALSELLTVIGPTAEQYINIISRSRIFEVASFDARCAVELAYLNRDQFLSQDEKFKREPYQKRKVDRQIIAICKVYGATEIYTDDLGLADHAELCGLRPICIEDVPIPDEALQGKLDLEKHEDLPAADESAAEAQDGPDI